MTTKLEASLRTAAFRPPLLILGGTHFEAACYAEASGIRARDWRDALLCNPIAGEPWVRVGTWALVPRSGELVAMLEAQGGRELDPRTLLPLQAPAPASSSERNPGSGDPAA